MPARDPKTSDIPWPQPQITQANYKQYAKPGWTVTTPGTVEQPRSTHYTEKDLNSLFTHPERKAAGLLGTASLVGAPALAGHPRARVGVSPTT